MPDLTGEALDDLNEAVSSLAYWVGSADSRALLQMTEGFGAAVAASASMRSDGAKAKAVALALAERAQALQVAKSAQHAGWLLLSIKLELMNHVSGPTPLPCRNTAEGLLREVDQIDRELMRRGTEVLAEV